MCSKADRKSQKRSPLALRADIRAENLPSVFSPLVLKYNFYLYYMLLLHCSDYIYIHVYLTGTYCVYSKRVTTNELICEKKDHLTCA